MRDRIFFKDTVKSKRIHTNIECKYKKKSWQIQVPAAAVIPEQLALFGVIGCNGCVDVLIMRCFTKFKNVVTP